MPSRPKPRIVLPFCTMSDSDSGCVSCGKAKTSAHCEVCSGAVCKKCLEQLDQDTFSFLASIPEQLKHTNYCGACFDELVAPELASYQETLKLAEGVFVFFDTQKKEIPLIKKAREICKVDACPDRDETILRLAFQAAELGYNGIISVIVHAKKLRNGAYQTSEWSGTGVPAQVNADRIEKQDLQNAIYR